MLEVVKEEINFRNRLYFLANKIQSGFTNYTSENVATASAKNFIVNIILKN